MAAAKTQASYRVIGLATASLFLLAFGFVMYQLEKAGPTPYKTQLKNGYATLDNSYLNPPTATHPLDVAGRRVRGETEQRLTDERARRAQFEFYSVLPEFQVEVQSSKPLPRRAAAQVAPSSRTIVIDQGDIVQVPTKAQQGNWLQAGAFADIGDASRRRAEIIMLGLSAQLEEIETDRGPYHRVKLGPFGSVVDRESARARMRDAGIESIVKTR